MQLSGSKEATSATALPLPQQSERIIDTWDTTQATNITNASVPPASLPTSPELLAGTVVFNITALCRNCSVSTGSYTLFDHVTAFDSFRPELPTLSLPSTVGKSHTSSRLRRSNTMFSRDFQRENVDKEGDVCLCPSNPILLGGEISPGNASHQGEFTDSNLKSTFLDFYSKGLKDIQTIGLVDVVKATTNLQEGQNIECSNDIKKFEFLVFSDMRVNLTSLTVSEVQELETVFKSAYNRYVLHSLLWKVVSNTITPFRLTHATCPFSRLAFQSCDGLFRQVEEVELRLAPTEYLDDSINLEEKNSAGRRLQEILRSLPANSNNYTNTTNTTDGILPFYINATINTTVEVPLEDRRSVVPVLFR